MTTFFVDADLTGAGEFVEATVSLATEYTLPAGNIARVRSWFPALAGATPLWRIYNATGTLLASGGFDTAVADAWNWGTIGGGGLAVSAGTYRVVIVVTRYKALGGFFSGGPITRGSITGNRGLFDSGDVAPTQVSTASYFADLDFTASGGDVAVADPVAGGASTGGAPDGAALGVLAGGGGTAGTADGVALGAAVGGGGTGGTPDGAALGDTSGGGGTGGTVDGLTIGAATGGAGTGGTADTLLTDTAVPDPVPGGAGTGGTPDTVTNAQVVHDQMVMPLALKARDCLVTEVGKLANPPIKVQIRPGASFAALVDSTRDECCSGVAYVRTGVRQPTTGNWPTPLSSVDGPSASRGRAALYAVTLELGIYRCLPTISNIPDTNDDFPTDDQWLQAAQDQADDGAALLRAVCCLQAIYGNDAVLAGPVTPLENEGPCSGIRVNVQLRAPACDCVD